ncbi:MAG TPA: exodeoxyribonuclease VII small subunit [Chloroflexota bacterium]|jgi:exodeoxyribonuclease VII small subunit
MVQNDKSPEQAASFEQTYDALRRAVEELESGSLPLDIALTRYEQAMALVRACNEILDQAELRIQRVGLDLPAREPAGDSGAPKRAPHH